MGHLATPFVAMLGVAATASHSEEGIRVWSGAGVGAAAWWSHHVSGEKVLYYSTRKGDWIPAKVTDLSAEGFKIEGRTASLPA